MGTPTAHIELPRSPWIDGSSWLPDVLEGTFQVRHAPGGLVIANGHISIVGTAGQRNAAVPAEFRPTADGVSIDLRTFMAGTYRGTLYINAAGTIYLAGGVTGAGTARFFTTWST